MKEVIFKLVNLNPRQHNTVCRYGECFHIIFLIFYLLKMLYAEKFEGFLTTFGSILCHTLDTKIIASCLSYIDM